MLKSAKFSSYILSQLGQILDVCENRPLIIRSSSLLEDQIDTSFPANIKPFYNKYGTKEDRLKQLVEGILEVYASMFNPTLSSIEASEI